MSTIRPHHKTRSGCKTCKRRKVKCDEELPECKNCATRGIECVWINIPQRANSVVSGISSADAASTRSHESPPSTISRRTGTSSFDLLTLELMHHYSTDTSHSLSSDHASISLWRTVIPKIAFDPKNQCLLHAILAMSALHAHHANPTAGQYAVAASTYYWQAKTGLHRADVDGKMDVDAVFITFSLIGLYEFATSSIISSYSSEWHTTVRTLPQKVVKDWLQLEDGILRPMVNIMAPKYIPTPLGELFPSSLSILLSKAHSLPDVEELHDVSVCDAYAEAIHILETSWKASFRKDYCMYASCMWWSMVPNTFIRLLAERKPRALIILAHYCVMMKRVAEDGPWWVRKQWGNEAARMVSTLDPRWTPCLGWISSQLDKLCEAQSFDFADTGFMNWLNEAGSLMPPAPGTDFMNWLSNEQGREAV
ncbi:hypothetical protein IW261DRAFT_1448227 [Armillaria novae-zelandiae]|uniref:Zn(2)-C6 fungal-type domain-containing protein n=1 Tax=Armillaria novae-zelandiae TaxID=153914 RepID=A0AA39UFR3_9AGAR|nr:hypothetical protein IW261DRAFT_1448227 [Armillaria novae-zelandiae]